MLKTTVGKVVAGVVAAVLVTAGVAGFYVYRSAQPWLSAKERMEELKDSNYSFEADVEALQGSLLPTCKVRGDKQNLQVHGDVLVRDELWADIYAGIGETTYVNTRYVTEHFKANVKETLDQIPFFGSMIYSLVEQAFPEGDRYMSMEQVQRLTNYIDLQQMTGGVTGTAFRKYTYRSDDATAWGTYEVNQIDGIDSMPEDYTVESDFFRITFSNGNVVEISVPKDATEKSDYIVLHTDSREVHVVLHYNTEEVKSFTYPTGSDFSEEDMQKLEEVFQTLQELSNS